MGNTIGLLRIYVPPPIELRCKARSERTGVRCNQWCAQDRATEFVSSVRRWHGAPVDEHERTFTPSRSDEETVPGEYAADFVNNSRGARPKPVGDH